MIQVPALSLDVEAAQALAVWQAEIDSLDAFEDRVKAAKTAFKSRNRQSNRTFKIVRQVLAAMCAGPRRCMYCEDSVADEVEHFRPKDLYPEQTFVWENYLYACGNCNGPKNNGFAVVGRGGALVRADDSRWGANRHLRPALIVPRDENPLAYLELDLVDTFLFVVIDELAPAARRRAEYTLDLLRLNERDFLPQARRDAFHAYRAQLAEYIGHLEDGRRALAERSKRAIMNKGHPTVWHEMCRQHDRFLREDEWGHLFVKCPDALKWMRYQTPDA